MPVRAATSCPRSMSDATECIAVRLPRGVADGAGCRALAAGVESDQSDGERGAADTSGRRDVEPVDGMKVKITKDGPYLVTGGVPLYVETIVADGDGESESDGMRAR